MTEQLDMWSELVLFEPPEKIKIADTSTEIQVSGLINLSVRVDVRALIAKYPEHYEQHLHQNGNHRVNAVRELIDEMLRAKTHVDFQDETGEPTDDGRHTWIMRLETDDVDYGLVDWSEEQQFELDTPPTHICRWCGRRAWTIYCSRLCHSRQHPVGYRKAEDPGEPWPPAETETDVED